MDVLEFTKASENRKEAEGWVINDKEKLIEVCEAIRKEGEKIVLMTGCFDLLHGGHLDALADAGSFGILVIGVNSDQFVKRLKGDERPIRKEGDRAYLMAGFKQVRLVTIFDDDCELMKVVKPHFYVASATSHEKVWDIPEQMALLKELGTKIIMFGPDKRDSTTAIIKRVILSVSETIEEKFEN